MWLLFSGPPPKMVGVLLKSPTYLVEHGKHGFWIMGMDGTAKDYMGSGRNHLDDKFGCHVPSVAGCSIERKAPGLAL